MKKETLDTVLYLLKNPPPAESKISLFIENLTQEIYRQWDAFQDFNQPILEENPHNPPDYFILKSLQLDEHLEYKTKQAAQSGFFRPKYPVPATKPRHPPAHFIADFLQSDFFDQATQGFNPQEWQLLTVRL